MKDIVLIVIIVTIIAFLIKGQIKKFRKRLKSGNICDPDCNCSCIECLYNNDKEYKKYENTPNKL